MNYNIHEDSEIMTHFREYFPILKIIIESGFYLKLTETFVKFDNK